MRRLRMIAASVLFGGSLAATFALGGGAVLAQSVPPYTQAPGYSVASTTGSCHGVFGDAFGSILSSDPGLFSSSAPSGNEGGEDNAAGGGCPYLGTGDTDD